MNDGRAVGPRSVGPGTRRWLFVGAAAMIAPLGGCRGALDAGGPSGDPPVARDAAEPVLASPNELARSPERYDHRKVRVYGFCSMTFEGTAIYASPEDYRAAKTREAIWLDVDLTEGLRGMHERKVMVEGVFDKTLRGHLQLYGGALHVERLEPWDDRVENGATRRAP